MKNKIGLFVSVCVMMAVFITLAGVLPSLSSEPPRADDSFTVKSYDATYEFEHDRTFGVSLDLVVEFNRNGKHGIIVDLPYNSGESYRDIESDSHIEVKRDAKNFISVYLYFSETGTAPVHTPLELSLFYRMSVPVATDIKQLSLNVLGSGWTAEIESMRAKVILPETPASTAGWRGTNSSIDLTVKENVISVTAQDLRPFTPVTFDMNMRTDALGGRYVEPSVYIYIVVALLLLAAVIVANVFTKKENIVPVVNFSTEKDPLYVGLVIDGKTSREDLTSLIFYWANKGYIRLNLENEDDPILLKDKNLPDGTPDYESILFDGIFSLGDEVAVSSLNESFYTTANSAVNAAKAHNLPCFKSKITALSVLFALAAALLAALPPFIAAQNVHPTFINAWGFLMFLPVIVLAPLGGYLVQTELKWTKAKKIGYVVLLFALAAVAAAVYGIFTPAYVFPVWARFVVGILTAGTMAVSALYRRRTREYAETLGGIVGFRDYIRLAEKDKMETMFEENPSFYYDILPYAQVLGVSDIWTDKFAGLSMQPPYWAMNTHVSLFDVYVIHSLLRSTSATLSHSFHSLPQGASGSGGGFGGGGFGGGGGGGFGGGGFGGGGGRSF